MHNNSEIPNPKPEILVIVGPTSSGKSELAVKLARRFHGEIISADSRQIYKGMDLGTGKVPGKWQRPELRRLPKAKGSGSQDKAKPAFIYKTIPHHLIDFTSPKRQYSAAIFQKQAQKAIKEINRRGRLPIICGGTGHWIDAVVYGQHLPEVKPNPRLRSVLDKKTAEELYARLLKLDPARAKSIDRHNKRRLVRALEIVLATGKPVPALNPRHSPYRALWIGITLSQEQLYKKIDKRLKARLKAGMAKEVERLYRQGLSWKRLESFGLEYRHISRYLRGKLSEEEMIKQLSLDIKHYAKRQMTWFKRNKDIHWIASCPQSLRLVKNFCSQPSPFRERMA